MTQGAAAGPIIDAASVEAPARNAFLNVMRLIAALSVVWIHSFDARPALSPQNIGRFAVPFFTVTAIWLMARRPETNDSPAVAAASWLSFVRRRFVRLYVPFLVWNVIYTLLREIKLRLLHSGGPTTFDVGWFTAGVAMQLWFLPFLFLAQCVAKSILMMAAWTGGWRIIAVAVCLAAVPFVIARPAKTETMDFTFFVAMAREATPAALVATAVAACGLHRRPVSAAACATGLAVGVAATAIVVLFGRSITIETLAGLAFATAAMRPIAGKGVRTVGAIGVYAFGIYLVHIVFQNLLLTAATRAHVRMTDATHVGIFLATASLSLLFCIALVRLPGGGRTAKWVGIKSA